jgi:hypothetical protein
MATFSSAHNFGDSIRGRKAFDVQNEGRQAKTEWRLESPDETIPFQKETSRRLAEVRRGSP